MSSFTSNNPEATSLGMLVDRYLDRVDRELGRIKEPRPKKAKAAKAKAFAADDQPPVADEQSAVEPIPESYTPESDLPW